MNLRAVFAAAPVFLLLATSSLRAQQAPAPSAAAGPSQLKIFILTGEGSIHRIALGLTTDVVVEVRDLNDFPVEGAEVRFTLPQSGPGGTFRGQRQYIARTNGNGQAVAVGFEPNGLEGRFQVAVDVVAGDRRAQTVVNQVNSLRPIASTRETKKKRFPTKLVLIGAAAGATVGLVLAFTGGSSTGPVTLTPGAIVIGASR